MHSEDRIVNRITQPEPVEEVSLFEVAQLPLRAAVAFAARCARRMQPSCQRIPADTPERKAQLEAIEAAIRLAEECARAVPGDADAAEAVAAETFNIGEAVGQFANYAPYCASHAARAAHWAYAPDLDQNYTEVIACTYGASRVVQTNADMLLKDMIVAALRADYERLVSLGLGQQAEIGKPIDPSETGPLGPLWPAGSPYQE